MSAQDTRAALLTKAEYNKLKPFDQGYVVYMQAEWPMSELKGLGNPYPRGSRQSKQWNAGGSAAMMSVLDGDDE